MWDLASGTLKLTLTGHISTVRGLAISARSPYLFSAGEDKMVKCWDLEYNKVPSSPRTHEITSEITWEMTPRSHVPWRSRIMLRHVESRW